MQPKPPTIRCFIAGAVLAVLVLVALLMVAGASSARVSRLEHTIHIAFGFHGNLYHSFRNDTNDEFGFGKDIRIIRHIIATLDGCNARGVPVNGVWDFDNLFSLQELLPQYAPDIISDLRRRVRDNGDEMILMSYNNGLVSAMTETELTRSMRWAISNPWQSGVQDIFGTYSPIVRPQEMMTTPGNFSIYKHVGIRAVALYYSATPFDAFRVFSRPLSYAEAYNPILYKHPDTKEEMVVIPSYHIGDLLEHVSLRHWVEHLRHLQEKGLLNHDALIFINFDADSDFWSGVDLPWALEWLPNTDGLGALIREVKDLPYVHFTTLNNYLASHPPVGTFYFSQDTADGSFNGYNSWAEKARTSPRWTIIERSRHVAAAARNARKVLGDPPELHDVPTITKTAELIRLRTLATTNFGMATPFVSRQRDLVATELLATLDRYSDDIESQIRQSLRNYLHQVAPPPDRGATGQWLGAFMVLSTRDDSPAESSTGGRFVRLPLADAASSQGSYWIAAPDGRILRALRSSTSYRSHEQDRLNLYVPGTSALGDGVYHLFRKPVASQRGNGSGVSPVRAEARLLTNGIIEVRFDDHGRVEGIYKKGVRQAEAGSLMPYIRYGDRIYGVDAVHHQRWVSADGTSASVRLTGAFSGPSDTIQSPGAMDYTLHLMADCPYLVLEGRLQYPATQRGDIINAGAPGLVRRADMQWREAAPAEIRFASRSQREDPVSVLKRNYLGVESRYRLDYFRHSPENLRLDDVNNHITESYLGVVAGDSGLAISADTTVSANFAFAPLKLSFDSTDATFHVRVNPFGTYYGRQYRPPTQGNGQGYEMTLHTGGHLFSAAPTYDGTEQTFNLLIAFFDGSRMPFEIRQDLRGFAHPPMAIPLDQWKPVPPVNEPLEAPSGLVATYYNGAVYFSWDASDEGAHFRIHCGAQPGRYQRTYPATGNSLKATDFIAGQSFAHQQRYYARIETVSADGRTSSWSEEISFTTRPRNHDPLPTIPLDLKIRILWANLGALLFR
jgi:hypothetical protein